MLPLPDQPFLPTTESANPASTALDQLGALDIARLMNAEDAQVPLAVERELPRIAEAMELIADRLRSGGRMFSIGAGTSGRLGVLDASECPPTFSVPPGLVIGVIAGGQTALTSAIEGAEDQRDQGALDLQAYALSQRDVVIGIASSGRTPYVLGALEYARSVGAATIGLACSPNSPMVSLADRMITPVVGPEILTGSTRLKAGTATKLVLNMLSTGAMVLLGKTYGNLMVDLRATNEKLRDRSVRIVQKLAGLSAEEARQLLEQCGGEVRTAIVAHRMQLTAEAARTQLAAHGHQLRRTLESNATISTPGNSPLSPHSPHSGRGFG